MTNFLQPVPTSPLQDPNDKINATNPIWVGWFTIARQQINISSKVFTGSGAPTFAPPSTNAEYRDLLNKKLYVAFGVADVTDWILINP